MSAYVAAGIAGSDQTKTGLWAVRLGLIGFLIPFFFLNNPILLLGVASEASLSATLWAVATALTGTTSLVMGMEGWILRRASVAERLILVTSAPFLLLPGMYSDVIGIGGLSGVLLYQIFQYHRSASVAVKEIGRAHV